MERSTSSTKTLKQRPFIQNATHPSGMFTPEEMDKIKACVERYKAKTFGWKTKNVSEKERAVVGDLLRQARFHGYFADGINAGGNIKWRQILEPYLPKQKGCSVMTVIQSCENCSMNFHADYYPGEQPEVLCEKHRKDAIKPIRPKPFYLKEMPKLPKISDAQREARIAELRRQKESLDIEDEQIPF